MSRRLSRSGWWVALALSLTLAALWLRAPPGMPMTTFYHECQEAVRATYPAAHDIYVHGTEEVTGQPKLLRRAQVTVDAARPSQSHEGTCQYERRQVHFSGR